jgi:hypothetical protein
LRRQLISYVIKKQSRKRKSEGFAWQLILRRYMQQFTLLQIRVKLNLKCGIGAVKSAIYELHIKPSGYTKETRPKDLYSPDCLCLIRGKLKAWGYGCGTAAEALNPEVQKGNIEAA